MSTTLQVTTYDIFKAAAEDIDANNVKFKVDIASSSGGATSVTVVNGAGASAVNIQDGGNSITVDGTVTADTELPAATTLADDLTPGSAPYIGTLNYGYVQADGNWDRWRMVGDNSDALGTASTGHMQVLAHGMVFNGTTWDRARGTIADGQLVNLGSNNDVTVTGTVTTSETKPSTNTTSSVAASVSSVTLLSANSSRLGATIHNDSTSACYVKLGTTASTSSFQVKLFSQDYYEVPFGYTGRIDAIWDSATGSARIGELTA